MGNGAPSSHTTGPQQNEDEVFGKGVPGFDAAAIQQPNHVAVTQGQEASEPTHSQHPVETLTDASPGRGASQTTDANPVGSEPGAVVAVPNQNPLTSVAFSFSLTDFTGFELAEFLNISNKDVAFFATGTATLSTSSGEAASKVTGGQGTKPDAAVEDTRRQTIDIEQPEGALGRDEQNEQINDLRKKLAETEQTLAESRKLQEAERQKTQLELEELTKQIDQLQDAQTKPAPSTSPTEPTTDSNPKTLSHDMHQADLPESPDEVGRLRADYKFVTNHNTEDVLQYLASFTNLEDPTHNPGCLDLATLLELLSRWQTDPTDQSKLLQDPRSDYRAKEREFRQHFQEGSDEREQLDNYLQEINRDRKVGDSISFEDLVEHHCRNYNRVAFLHLVTPPVITPDRFSITYINNEGLIKKFETDASDFYNERRSSARSGGWALTYSAGTALICGGLFLTASTPLAIAASITWFCVGGFLATNQLLKAESALNNSRSKYNSLVIKDMLDLVARGLSGAEIILPLLAHMHFVQRIPEEARAKKYGTVDPVDNSPLSDLAQHIGAITYLTRSWSLFETSCPDLSERRIDESKMTILRQDNIDKAYLQSMVKDANELAETLLRWQESTIRRARDWTAILSLGLSEWIRDGKYYLERLLGPWGFNR